MEMGGGVLAGSVVTIGCRKDANTSEISTASVEELRCENGVWREPKLECFADCPADLLVLGSQYRVATLGLSDIREHSVVPHGSRVFATCADGFTPPNSSIYTPAIV